MNEQEKIQNTGKMDIKWHSKGERASLKYSGEIQIITTELWNKFARQASKAEELEAKLEQLKERHKDELRQLQERYEFEIAKLRNQLAEERRKAKRASESLKQRERRIPEAVQIKSLFEQNMGKGRPSKLTEQHKDFLRQNLAFIIAGITTVKDLYRHLVQEMGYTGEYEPVRAFVADLKK